MALVAKGYRVVPQALADAGAGASRGFRHLHLKEHKGLFKAAVSAVGGEGGRETTAAFARGTTLFVGNVDDQGGRLCRKTIEARLRRALSPCGKILHVQVSAAASAAADGGVGDARGTTLAGRKHNAAARFAHVCFSSTKGVQQALALEQLPSGGSTASATGGGEGGADTKAPTRDDEEEDPEEELRDENGDETCGYAALIQRHRRKFPPRQALQEEVDATMLRFEEAESAEIAQRKAMLENPEGDDGFVTVTYKRKRGRNSGGGTGNPPDGVVAGGAKKKRKGAGELSDFYRFQMRETRREQLATLRSKFEQDKARVAKMKEQRKFRPF
ncbi:unnamed protein product [Ectocarpus sp. 6 AP-2014]